MKRKRFWIVAYPDLTKPVGGIKQLHRVSEIISSTGHICHLIQDDESFSPRGLRVVLQLSPKSPSSEIFRSTLTMT